MRLHSLLNGVLWSRKADRRKDRVAVLIGGQYDCGEVLRYEHSYLRYHGPKVDLKDNLAVGIKILGVV